MGTAMPCALTPRASGARIKVVCRFAIAADVEFLTFRVMASWRTGRPNGRRVMENAAKATTPDYRPVTSTVKSVLIEFT